MSSGKTKNQKKQQSERLTVFLRQGDDPLHLPDGASERRLDGLTRSYTDLLDQLTVETFSSFFSISAKG